MKTVLAILAIATIFNSQIVSSTEVHHRLMLPSGQANIDAERQR